MKLLKNKIMGVLMLIFVLVFGVWYSLCVFMNSGLLTAFIIPDSIFQPNFLGIPLLNSYWTIALPIYLLVLIVLFIAGWLGIATIIAKPPKVSEEEINRIMTLEKKLKDKKEKEKS
ncbi:MAG: hypothetical protein GF329_01755 [Candidatus Lokiarchaeota archaeon]|nr:hypothetical protein [Candidatus Lokiarchaeota archaeon]